MFLPGGSRDKPVSKFIQFVGQIWFLVVVGLGFPLYLEAAHIPSHEDTHQQQWVRPSPT